MKGADWKDIAELIGIAAIVASLVFVGLQMRQTHDIALVTLYQMRADAAREVASVSLDSEALHEVYKRLNAGEEVSESDLSLVRDSWFLFFNHFENSHFLYQEGFLSEEHWQSDLISIVEEMRDPFVRDFWTDAKIRYRESFVDVVDEALAQ